MPVYKTRFVGILVMIILVAAGSLLGCYTSLNSMYSELVTEFQNGVDKDGICVMSDLRERADCAVNMCTIARRYLKGTAADQVDALSDLAASLSSALDDGRDLERIRAASSELEPAMNAVYTALESDSSVSAKDAKLYVGEYARFSSRGDTIKHDHYNTAAAEYNAKTSNAFARAVISFTPAKEAVVFN